MFISGGHLDRGPTNAQWIALLNEPATGGHGEYYHNNNLFQLEILPGHTNKETGCATCRLKFPAVGFGCAPPNDLVLVHMERWQYPEVHLGRRTGRLLLSSQERRAFLHPKYTCVLRRHPYFWKNLVEISDDVKERLNDSHRELLLNQLAITV